MLCLGVHHVFKPINYRQYQNCYGNEAFALKLSETIEMICIVV